MVAYVLLDIVICVSLGLLYIFVVVSSWFDFYFSVLAKRLAGTNISTVTCFCRVDVKS